jgi:hypothetical protein
MVEVLLGAICAVAAAVGVAAIAVAIVLKVW